MLTHNTHYPTDSKFLNLEDCLSVKGSAFVVYDIVKGKYLTPLASWSKDILKAEVFSSRSVVKSVFPESHFFAQPVKWEVV